MSALRICNKNRTVHHEAKLSLADSPHRKQVCNDAFDVMTVQARKMKQTTQNQSCKQFDIGSILQVPLANIDTTKEDGKNIICCVDSSSEGNWATHAMAC